MQISMQNAEGLNRQQIEEFLKGSEGIGFSGESRAVTYKWVERLLVAQEFTAQSKKLRGMIRRYASRITGLSLPQITRLIRNYVKTGTVELKPSSRRRFPGKYTDRDIALLAEVDGAHERLSGPATLHILKREHAQYGRAEYVRLAGISVSHIYNLRGSVKYRRQATVFEPTRPSVIQIGERRRPEPNGRPGFLRVDTVHQGDWESEKGVYHINAVDTVTQFEALGCTSRITAEALKPILEAMFHQFPFPVLGAHFDNGSEYINYTIEDMLKALLVMEFTKSRACRSQDNALVEGKNGAIVRKLIGYGHIPAQHAEQLQKFYTAHLNPYLNFHRPCGFATVSLDTRGKRHTEYKPEDYATPWQKLKSLPGAAAYLKPGISMESLDRIEGAMSDTECAKKMGAAKAKVLRACKIESPYPPRIR